MPERQPRLVLFDIDGTLIRAYGAGRQALVGAFREVFGLSDAADHLDPAWFAGKTDLFIFRRLALDAGITAAEYHLRSEALESCYLGRLRRAMADHPDKSVLPGVPDLLERVSRIEGVLLGLMTGNLEPGARIKLAPWDLNRYLPAGGFGGDAADRAAIGAVAVHRFEGIAKAPIPPDSVTLIGDTVADIRAARECGFRVLSVATGWTERPTLEAESPDAHFDDLSDTGAVLSAMRLA